MDVTSQEETTPKRRRNGLWIALALGLLVVVLLAGWALGDRGAQPAEAKVPLWTATPTLTPVPTLTSTGSPTIVATPTVKPTIVPTPTLIPLSVLSPALASTQEDPSARAPSETVSGAAESNQEDEPAQWPEGTGHRFIFVGDYDDQAELGEGQFQLAVQGRAVHATLQSVLSPVQHYAREQPTVLFTVPEGFRPATNITWDINGQYVTIDGQPDPNRRDIQVFRLRVDTAGHVRYVDDLDVVGVGHLRYHTTLAWPLAGTDPQVCARSYEIRNQIQVELHVQTGFRLACDQVTWEHLAQIQAVAYTRAEAVQPEDWLGLTNVTRLEFESRDQVALNSDLLAHTPRLSQLGLKSRDLTSLPAALLEYTPSLRHLALHLFPRSGDPIQDLPVDWLTHTPHLHSMELEIHLPVSAVAQLLDQVPRLTHLTVLGLSKPLPENFLAAVPHLTHLTVNSRFEPCPARDFLAPVPQLAHFKLRKSAGVACLAASLRIYAPVLHRFELDLYAPDFPYTGVLPSTLKLTHLTLDVANVTSLPADFLAQSSQLTNLRLYCHRSCSNSGFTLPTGLLNGTPLLSVFEVDVPVLENLPSNLLAPVPRLQKLHLNTGALESLPDGFLDPVPALESLTLIGGLITSLPDEFLADMLRLRELEIAMDRLGSLPANFLMRAPHLQSFTLRAGTSLRNQVAVRKRLLDHTPILSSPRPYVPPVNLTALQSLPLPTGFLLRAPQFPSFTLMGGGNGIWSPLVTLPDSFLAYTPRLTTLRLDLPHLQALPSSFLAHSPQLEHLELQYEYGKNGKQGNALLSIPAHFLANAPNLTYLSLGAIERVQVLPAGFLANSPQLEYLDLGVSVTSLPAGFLALQPQLTTVTLSAPLVTALPQGFLTFAPQLESLNLDLKQVTALPRGFLTYTPKLHFLKMDMNQVTVLPASFLSHTPQLEYLNLRTDYVTELHEDFLSHTPRVKTLGLAMPQLAPSPGPGHPLWSKLQVASYRVKIADPDFQVVYDGFFCQGDDYELKVGDILEVNGRELDADGYTMLFVFPWFDRDLFLVFYERHQCGFHIGARFTEPTLEV